MFIERQLYKYKYKDVQDVFKIKIYKGFRGKNNALLLYTFLANIQGHRLAVSFWNTKLNSRLYW